MKLARKIISLLLAAAISVTAAPMAFAKDNSFVHAEGTAIIGTDGNPLIIRGISFGNCIWTNPELPPETHHDEAAYKELAELGFNSVRFFLNYALFEDDDNPYHYKQSGFDWLDQNIRWAKKHGIGLILNMHYPQGGYQSQGDGTELWSNPENINRLTKLWSAIAEHCADEPVVWGYGLVNEPYLPLIGSRENTIEFYEKTMNQMAAEVRKAAPQQMIFVERMCNIKGFDWDKVNLYAEIAYPLIEGDDNIVYEFHFYEPFSLTHSVTYGNPNPPVYPSVDINASTFESTWVDTKPAEMKSEYGGWEYFETQPISAAEEYNVGILTLNTGGIRNGGSVCFDDLRVTELSDTGSRVLYEYHFDSADEIGCFYKWSYDGLGTLEFSEDGRSGGCCRVSGTTSDLTGGGDRFRLEEGKQYIVSGYVRTSGLVDYARPRLDLAKATEFVTMDKDYLEQRIMENIIFSQKHNVPLYLGEFGCCNDSFRNSESPLGWVEDVIDICYKHEIGFDYHSYHEPMFGLHCSDGWKQLPSDADLNHELAELFADKLHEAPATQYKVSTESVAELLKKLLPFI